jgi:hypothetical protein
VTVTLPTPGSDTNTWGPIVNAALAALDAAQTTLSGTVSGVSSSLSALSSTVSSLGTTVTTLAGKVLPAAGVAGDLLVKTSATDYAVTWAAGRQVFVQAAAPVAGSGQRIGDLWVKVAV